MKNIKRIFVALLALVASFVMIGAVSAANNGSITINGTTSGKTYEVYKIFDLTYSGSGSDLKVAYTINDAWKGFFTGAGSKYIVSESTIDGVELSPISIEKAGTTPQEYETKYINITESNVAEFATDALAYLGVAANNITKTKDAVATGETTVIEGLEYGYYLVYPEGATEIDDNYASIASLTSTTPEAEVNIKATYPTIDKTADGPSYEVGTYATFTITGKVPDTTGFTSYTYAIHDSWTAGLEYVEAGFNMMVKVGTKTVTVNSENLTLTRDSDNNVTGFTLNIDVKNQEYSFGDVIEVKYSLLVNEKAIHSTTTNNHAYLEYSNNPLKNSTSTTTPIEVPVYSSSIELLKVAGESCAGEGSERVCTVKLAGAKFVLMNADKTKYYQIVSFKKVGNEYKVADVAWVSNIDEATEFTTNEDGIIETVVVGDTEYTINAFEGLKDGTYYIVETEAPVGYNKLLQPVSVELVGETDEDTERDVPRVKNVTVENNTGKQLPSTGGMGAKLFIVIGLLLALVSAVVLVTNKRMAKVSL